jgi:hypothetical protein
VISDQNEQLPYLNFLATFTRTFTSPDRRRLLIRKRYPKEFPRFFLHLQPTRWLHAGARELPDVHSNFWQLAQASHPQPQFDSEERINSFYPKQRQKILDSRSRSAYIQASNDSKRTMTTGYSTYNPRRIPCPSSIGQGAGHVDRKNRQANYRGPGCWGRMNESWPSNYRQNAAVVAGGD